MNLSRKYFTFDYNETDAKYIEDLANYLEKAAQRIIDFFEIKHLTQPVYFKFWDSIKDFKKYLIDTDKGYESWVVGHASGKEYRIDLLSLKARREAPYHRKDAEKDLFEMVVHEFVHMCYYQYVNYKDNLLYIQEGLAIYLSNQYSDAKFPLSCSLEDLLNETQVDYSNYRLIFDHIFKTRSKDYILKLARDKQFATQETPKS